MGEATGYGVRWEQAGMKQAWENVLFQKILVHWVNVAESLGSGRG